MTEQALDDFKKAMAEDRKKSEEEFKKSRQELVETIRYCGEE